MSKETYVGGDIIETTGGNNLSYAKDVIENIGLQVIQDGKTNGVFYGINKDAPIISTNINLKKFLVHFRRPKNYDGKYGFDWLREEYIYPMVTVTNDNNGNPINAPTALCKNTTALKQEYLNGVVNNIKPYTINYYPAWLAIFPHTTTSQFPHGSDMHENGVNLDLQIDEIDQIISDGTEILFESQNQYLKISPKKIAISDVISSNRKSRNVNGRNINYYKLERKVNIKCTGGVLNKHEEIKVFAKLDQEKVEVGKLMVYKNNVIPKAEIVVVNVLTGGNKAQLKDDYQYLFKRQSFNQALIRAEVKVDTEFDLNKLNTNPDINNFLISVNGYSAKKKLSEIIRLYELYGKYTVPGGINSNNTHRTYLFFTSLSSGGTRGICSLNQNNVWGNSYLVFNIGLQNPRTIIHECGHSFSLPHTFEQAGNPRHVFYQGYTDAYMDYDWRQGGSPNPYSSKMYSIFKWQWEIMRNDRSLIFNY
ncbi:zinc metalloprotease [Kaistella carnis]|nr:hypothetical protein [Kaistella carnis]